MSLAELPDFDKLWDYGNPSGTEQKFREILESLEPGDNEGYRAELLTQIARTQGLQRRIDEAHATLDEAEALDSSKEGRPRVRLLLERGRAFNSSSKKDQAQPLFNEAWFYGNSIGEDGLAVDAGHMMAIVLTGDEALRWNLLSLSLATTSAQPAATKWRKSLHNNIGWTYFDMGQFDVALDHFRKCREYAAEMGDGPSEAIARWSIAKSLRKLGQIDEAIGIQEKLLAESGDPAGFRSEEMGECLLALGKADEAKPYFAKAHELLSADPWLQDQEPERIARLKELAG